MTELNPINATDTEVLATLKHKVDNNQMGKADLEALIVRFESMIGRLYEMEAIIDGRVYK